MSNTQQTVNEYECVFIDACDGTGECYQCGRSRKEHEEKHPETLIPIAPIVDALVRQFDCKEPTNDGICATCGSTILLGRMRHHKTWCKEGGAA